MKQYEIEITGTTPILMHGSQSIGTETTVGKKKGGDALTGDPEEWRKTIYFNDEVGVYLPPELFEASWMLAGKEFKSGRTNVVKYVKSGVMIKENFLPFYSRGKPIRTLEDVTPKDIDIRSVKNPSTKGRNMRYRARFFEWSTKMNVIVTADDYITQQMLKDIISYSGKFVGVGDWRPKFGQYIIKSIKEVKVI